MLCRRADLSLWGMVQGRGVLEVRMQTGDVSVMVTWAALNS